MYMGVFIKNTRFVVYNNLLYENLKKWENLVIKCVKEKL